MALDRRLAAEGDCTFWYKQEYSDGGFNWQSHVISFKFTSCE